MSVQPASARVDGARCPMRGAPRRMRTRGASWSWSGSRTCAPHPCGKADTVRTDAVRAWVARNGSDDAPRPRDARRNENSRTPRQLAPRPADPFHATDRVGFEPTVPFPARRFSRPVPSTARTPVQRRHQTGPAFESRQLKAAGQLYRRNAHPRRSPGRPAHHSAAFRADDAAAPPPEGIAVRRSAKNACSRAALSPSSTPPATSGR